MTLAQDGVSSVDKKLGRNFTLLCSASWISSVGDGIRNAALPLLATTITSSPSAISLLSIARVVPILVLSVFSGLLADRMNSRNLVFQTLAARFAVMAIFAGVLFTTRVALPALIVVALLLGCGETLFENSAAKLLTSVVPTEQLRRANGQLQASLIFGVGVAGPLIGSALFSASTELPFVLDSLSFGIAAILIARLSYRKVAVTAPRGSALHDIGEGLRWLWEHKGIRLLALVNAIVSMAFQLTMTTLVLLVTRVLHSPPAGYGLVLAGGAVGGILGGMLAEKIGRRLPGLRVNLALAIGSMGGAAVVLSLSPFVALVAVMEAVVLFGVGFWNVQVISARQQIIPHEFFGRVNSAYLLLNRTGMIVGVSLSGWIGNVAGVRAPILVGGLILIGTVLTLPALNSLKEVK